MFPLQCEVQTNKDQNLAQGLEITENRATSNIAALSVFLKPYTPLSFMMNSEDRAENDPETLSPETIQSLRAMVSLRDGPIVLIQGSMRPTLAQLKVQFDTIQEVFDALDPETPRAIVFDLRGVQRPSANARVYIKKRCDTLHPQPINIAIVTDWNTILFNTTIKFILSSLIPNTSFHTDLQSGLDHTHTLLRSTV